MIDLRYPIGVSSWIIQDENYSDFESGSRSRFALEFYSEKGLSIETGGHESVGLSHRRDACYTGRGVVRFATAEAWVVDFGDIMAFHEGLPPRGIVPGVAISGELRLGIDPFFYFEHLFQIPRMPPLIYEWQIEEIQIETAPFVETTDNLGRKVLLRDSAMLSRKPVPRTDAWHDDSGNADYVFICRRTSSAAFRHIDPTFGS